MKGYQIECLERDEIQKKWKGTQFVHGIQLLTFSLEKLHTWDAGLYDHTGNNFIRLHDRLKDWLAAASCGNVIFDGDKVSVIGRLEKHGKRVIFIPLGYRYVQS